MKLTKAALRRYFKPARERHSFRFSNEKQKPFLDLAKEVRRSHKDAVPALLDALRSKPHIDPGLLFDSVEMREGLSINFRAAPFVFGAFSQRGVHIDISKRKPAAIKLSKTNVDKFNLLFVLGEHSGRGIPYRGYVDLGHKTPIVIVNVTSALARFGRCVDLYLDYDSKNSGTRTNGQSKDFPPINQATVVGSLTCMNFFDVLLEKTPDPETFFLNGVSAFVSNDALRYYAILRAKQEWADRDAPFLDIGFLSEVVYGKIGHAFFSDSRAAALMIEMFGKQAEGRALTDFFHYQLNRRTACCFERAADELFDREVLDYLSQSCFVMPDHLDIYHGALYCPSY